LVEIVDAIPFTCTPILLLCVSLHIMQFEIDKSKFDSLYRARQRQISSPSMERLVNTKYKKSLEKVVMVLLALQLTLILEKGLQSRRLMMFLSMFLMPHVF
jgi:hypothetical protein